MIANECSPVRGAWVPVVAVQCLRHRGDRFTGASSRAVGAAAHQPNRTEHETDSRKCPLKRVHARLAPTQEDGISGQAPTCSRQSRTNTCNSARSECPPGDSTAIRASPRSAGCRPICVFRDHLARFPTGLGRAFRGHLGSVSESTWARVPTTWACVPEHLGKVSGTPGRGFRRLGHAGEGA